MRLIVADVRSTSTDGIAAGHYFTVAQNYLDLFGAEMDVRIAGGPVYGDRFGNKLIRLPHDYIVGSSAVRNKRAVFQNVRALLREAQDDVIVLQCSAVATAYLGLALFKKKETRVYAIQYSTDGVNSVLKRGAVCAVQAENQRRYLPQCSHWRGVWAADVRRIRLHQHRNDAAACAVCAEVL